MKNQDPTLTVSNFIKYIFPSVLILLPFSGQSQNYIIQGQQTSFHSGVQIAYNSFENHYAVLPGYTFNGRLTVGFDIGKTKDRINKINSTVLRPNVSYLILKQSTEGPPISFDLNAGYQFNYVSQIAFNARSVQFGFGIHHQISPLENVRIIPAILVEGNKATTGLNPRFDESVFLSYGLQASIVWNNYYITPKYLLFDGISTIGVKLGIVFSNIEAI